MALKELESPFNGLDKESVQEWLVHPVTQRISARLSEGIKDAKERIFEGVMNDSFDLGEARELAVQLMEVAHIFKEANAYAR